MTADTFPADPALTGLYRRLPGSPCTTPCEPDCTYTCHERHQPPASRRHDDFYCDQIALGRDVSEYKPEIRLRREAALHAAQMRMEVGTLRALRGRYDGGFEDGDAHFTSRRPRLWRLRRAWMRLRGWDA